MAATSDPAEHAARADRPPAAGPRPDGQEPAGLDGARFRDLLNAGLTWLERHHEIVNALNVFPVPDGDTGTNMLLTMKSACQEISAESVRTVGEVARVAAHGALMGARGNSGVILSQILRGMSRSLDDYPSLTGVTFAAALSEGSRIAYRGVNRPVEGTILTVVREAAAAAESAATINPDLAYVLDRAVRAADEAVANTPNLLPVLAQAGKVDSGGKGLYYILQGLYRALIGEPVAAEAARPAEPEARAPRPPKGKRELPRLVYGFDVQFLLENRGLDIDYIRERISAMGDCPLVEGDESLVKVHVHVPDPGVPLSFATSLGFVTDVVVENMDDMQIPDMPAGYDPVPPRFKDEAASEPAADEDRPIGPIEGPAVVAVVPGKGLAHVFRSLGAHRIVSGGQTMNPSTQDLLAAIREVPADRVVLLPNNGNIVMAAQQAQALAESEGKQVAVVPSRSIPQGISALLALNPHHDIERNAQAMTSAMAHVQTGEVTIAVQDASFDGIHVHAGDVIGLLNDMLTATGPAPDDVVLELLEQMGAGELEVITLYFGQPVSAREADGLLRRLQEIYTGQEIEIVDGGQPFYHYIISAE